MSTIDQWNNAAATYASDQEQSAFVALNKRIVAQRFADLSGASVLDLGCGYGVYSDYFASVGARVVGVDGAVEMLRLARARYPHVAFEQVDILQPLPFAGEQFDLVFCNQVLMDVNPIEPLLREIGRVLRPGGVFFMGVVHPAFFDAHWQCDADGYRRRKIMERYLSEYHLDNPFWGCTRHYHRPLSAYFNACADAGLRLCHMQEPVSYDGITKTQEFPLFLFAEFRKESAGT